MVCSDKHMLGLQSESHPYRNTKRTSERSHLSKAGDGDTGSSVHGSGRDGPGQVTGREKDPRWTPGKMRKINQEMKPGRLEAKESGQRRLKSESLRKVR